MAATCMDRVRELEKRGYTAYEGIEITRRQVSKCRMKQGILFTRLSAVLRVRGKDQKAERDVAREILGVVGVKKEPVNAKRRDQAKKGKPRGGV